MLCWLSKYQVRGSKYQVSIGHMSIRAQEGEPVISALLVAAKASQMNPVHKHPGAAADEKTRLAEKECFSLGKIPSFAFFAFAGQR